MQSEKINVEASEEVENESKEKPFLNLTKKQRKRENKSIDHVLGDLPEDLSTEDKLILLYRKYSTLVMEHDNLLLKSKQTDKRQLLILGERDQLQNDYSRIVMQKEKLESVCRELQKQNHEIKRETIQASQEEDNKRKEMADHFRDSIVEIQKQMGDYLKKNAELKEENQKLSDKLTEFIADHEKRESHIQKLIKTRELEAKLSEAKLSQAKIQHEQELLKSEQKIARFKEETDLMRKRMEAHQTVEDKQKEQIEFYKQKYQEFNKVMNNNSNLVEDAKKEMEKMAKHVRLADSHVLDWRERWETSQKSLLEVSDELKREKSSSASLSKQVERLSGLCRALKATQHSQDHNINNSTVVKPNSTPTPECPTDEIEVATSKKPET